MTKCRLYIVLTFLAATITSCSQKRPQNAPVQADNFALPTNSILYAQFPLVLSDFNLRETGIQSPISSQTIEKIKGTVKNYHSENYSADSAKPSFKINDIYFRTIVMQTQADMIYLVLFKHLPGAELNCKVLIYNKVSNSFLGPLDFNLFALYELDHDRLVPSNLKVKFHITSPEIQFVGFDSESIPKYRFTRLAHNGTYNAIETTVLSVHGARIDTIEHKLISPSN